ncbi:Acg family FMN-binding oxidoreductase [Williamsia sp. SKLECPSW1]
MSELPITPDDLRVTTGDLVGHGPDRSTVRTAVALASMAPSIHNSQPWEWRVGDASLHLFCATERHLPVTDPDDRDLWVSLGICLAHMRVALRALGWDLRVHRLPDPAAPDHVASMQFLPHRLTTHDSALAAAITRRRSDRRRYSSWPVHESILDGFVRTARTAGVIARLLPPSADLAAAAWLAADRHARDEEYRAELSAWTRGRRRDDGIPAANRQTATSDPLMARRFEMTGGAHRVPGAPPDDRAAGELLVLSTAGDDTMSRLRAGEAAGSVLLEATTHGLSTCVMTEILEVRDTRRVIRDRLAADSLFPQVMIRLGWPVPGSPPLPATPRRPIDDVVRELDIS